MKDFEAEVGIKDIIEFYIKINDSARTKSDMAKMSAKDKASAFTLISQSNASREFKIEIARYFVNDLDFHIRRKAELILESLIPGWVADPASNILQVLRSAENKGPARRNAAVRFLFGIVDADSLRITLTSLLSSRNRSHIAEIVEIVEQYILASEDEPEQVKIFNACLDIVLSDEIEMSAKHHATNLLSVFFKKVATTALGAHLKAKYIEKQVEKGESVYRFLCSGSTGLTASYLEDLIRPLQDAGTAYQLKMLTYFRFVLDKLWDEEEIGSIIDTWPDSWEPEEINRVDKAKMFRSIILKHVEELWDYVTDEDVKDAVMAVVYSGHQVKNDLFATIRANLSGGTFSDKATDKMARVLYCFLKADQQESLRLQAANLLLFNLTDKRYHLAALSYLQEYIEKSSLNYAEQNSLITGLIKFADAAGDDESRLITWFLVFLEDPLRLEDEDCQKQVLAKLRAVVEKEQFTDVSREKISKALTTYKNSPNITEKSRKAAAYLLLRLQNPNKKPTWEMIKRL